MRAVPGRVYVHLHNQLVHLLHSNSKTKKPMIREKHYLLEHSPPGLGHKNRFKILKVERSERAASFLIVSCAQLSSTKRYSCLAITHTLCNSNSSRKQHSEPGRAQTETHRGMIIFFSNVTACFRLSKVLAAPTSPVHMYVGAPSSCRVFSFFLSTLNSRPSFCTHSFVGIFSFAALDGIIPACLHLTLEVMTEGHV